jgi:nucleotide-binding universal stress UspA family protein
MESGGDDAITCSTCRTDEATWTTTGVPRTGRDTPAGLWDAPLLTMLEQPLVVVPIDSSEPGEAAVAYAVALARRRGAAVDLLHVVRPRGPSAFDSPDLAADPASSTLGHIDHPTNAARSDALTFTPANDVRIRHVTYRGQPSKAVAAYVQLATASVIVIGKYYGSSRWRKSVGVASSLSRSTPVPVLVVPPQQPGEASLRTGPFANIVSAVDFTVSSALALRTAVDLARTSGGRVTLVHALTNAPGRMVFSGSEAFSAIDEAQAEASNIAARLRREIPASAAEQVESRVITGTPDRGIIDVASQIQADLIVMGVPPRGRIDEVLSGSTLRGVLRRATIPVLVLPVVAGAHEWIVGAGR